VWMYTYAEQNLFINKIFVHISYWLLLCSKITHEFLLHLFIQNASWTIFIPSKVQCIHTRGGHVYYLLLLDYRIQVLRCSIDTIISYLILPLTLFIIPFRSKTFNRIHLHVDHSFQLSLLFFLSESGRERAINFVFKS